MAIAPKNPRKRAAKKTPKVKGEVSPETTPVASVIEAAAPEEKKTKPAKKAAVIPVAIFQKYFHSNSLSIWQNHSHAFKKLAFNLDLAFD